MVPRSPRLLGRLLFLCRRVFRGRLFGRLIGALAFGSSGFGGSFGLRGSSSFSGSSFSGSSFRSLGFGSFRSSGSDLGSTLGGELLSTLGFAGLFVLYAHGNGSITAPAGL